jgi:P4 family phage/plasmid primase-like protien
MKSSMTTERCPDMDPGSNQYSNPDTRSSGSEIIDLALEPDGRNHIFNEKDIIESADCRVIARKIGFSVNEQDRCVASWRNGKNYSVQLNKEYYFDHKTKESGNVIELVAKCKKCGGSQELAQDYLGNLLKCPPKDLNISRVNQRKLRINQLLDRGYTPTDYYDYKDFDGTLVFQVIRLEQPEDSKQFLQRTPKFGLKNPDNENSGDWFYSLSTLKQQRQLPLFNLPNLVGEDNVYFLEGEKDVLTAQQYGWAATCNAGGSGSIKHVDLSSLHGKYVTIIPDNDFAGYAGALVIKRALQDIAREVKVLGLPIDTDKADLSDYVACLKDKKGLDNYQVSEALLELTNDSTHYLTDTDIHKKMALLKPDARELTSPVNGTKGGRPRVSYSAIAKQFADMHSLDGYFKYRKYRGQWYWFNERIYLAIPESELEHRVMAFLQEQENIRSDCQASINNQKNVIANLSAEGIGAFISTNNLPRWLNEGDASGWLVMSNGMVNIENIVKKMNGEDMLDKDIYRPHSIELFTTFGVDYEYDITAHCHRWIKYIQETLPDTADQEFLQMMFGLSLVPDTSYEVFFTLYGKSGTGKSVCLSVLEALVGSGNTCCVPLNKMADKFSQGKLTENLLNIVGDLPTSDGRTSFSNIEGLLKDVASGGAIPVEHKYGDPYFGKAIARCIFATNSLPIFSDSSNGIADRLRILPFNQVFRGTDKQNPHLRKELINELPGIFIWALQGLAMLRKMNHFPYSDAGKAIADEHRLRCDHVRAFLAENCIEKTDGYVLSSILYKAYQNYCKDNGFHHKSSPNFFQELKCILPSSQKRKGRGLEGNLSRIHNITWASTTDQPTPLNMVK